MVDKAIHKPTTTKSMPAAERYQRCLDVLTPRRQQHLLRWWDELTPPQREQLLADLESIPWDVVDGVMATHVRARPPAGIPTDIQPPTGYTRVPTLDLYDLYLRAADRGERMIRDGRVAAFTVAGGQGTRLGFDGPKGTLVVTPVGSRTLFQLFADTILAVRRKYTAKIPWYIMTSPANHAQTVEYFESHGFFDLPRGDVHFLTQGMLPQFGFDGRVFLAQKHRVLLGADGHGGSLKAMAVPQPGLPDGALADMRGRGVEVISYFQVDNPLVRPFDPLFIGLHAETGSEMSTKVARKADALEHVGNVCLCDGRVRVIEYTEFPEELARRRHPSGAPMFDGANLAIHLLSVDFVRRIVGDDPASRLADRLPLRRAEKAVPVVDDAGRIVRSDEPNAVKLEMFVFDALPLAANPLVFETSRAEEFSPVKNATGIDSLATSRRDQIARACLWLESAGIAVPRHADGTPAVTIGISPLFALDADELQARRPSIPKLHTGDAIWLE